MFLISKLVKARPIEYLFAIKQQVEESLFLYANHFHVETLGVSSFWDEIALSAFHVGLLAGDPGTFLYKMAYKPYKSYAEAHEAALQYVVADESKS